MLEIIRASEYDGNESPCIRSMKALLEASSDCKIIMTVPDQYSYIAEEAVCASFGGAGLNGVEVLTFRQMTRRFVKTDPDKYLLPSGRQMLLLKAVSEAAPDNIFHASRDKSGFLEIMSSLISELERCVITPDMLFDAAKKTSDDAFNRKLSSIADVFDRYRNLCGDSFLDSEDDIVRLASAIYESDRFEKTHIFFDEFTDFLPSHYEVIRALMKKSAGVHIVLGSAEDINDEVYTTAAGTYSRLLDLCASEGIVPSEPAYYKSPLRRPVELRHLIANYGRVDRTPFNEKPEHISLYSAFNVFDEVEHAADEIISYVRDKGARWRDICVAVSDADEYMHIVNAIFSAYGIPYFSDERTRLSDHPIAAPINGVFDIFDTDYSFNAVFRYLKCGFIGIKTEDGFEPFPDEEIDRLENFALKCGIRGRKRWCDDEWNQRFCEGAFSGLIPERFAADIPEDARQMFIKPLISLREKTKGRHRINEIAVSFYEFLSDIALFEMVEYRADSLQRGGNINEAEKFRGLWNLIIEALDQLCVVRGSDSCTLSEFGRYLREGLAACELRSIPAGVDLVNVGTADKSPAKSAKAVFILGAAMGRLPKDAPPEGILTDRERGFLEDAGCRLAPNTKKQFADMSFKLYRLITKPTDYLYISVSLSDTDGKAYMPSSLIDDIKRIFPKIEPSNPLTDKGGSYIASPETVFRRILRRDPDPIIQSCIPWFYEQESWRARLDAAKNSAGYYSGICRIPPETAAELYDDPMRFSASSLETYFNCPFSSFVTYGLKARERESFSYSAADIGTLTHDAVREYCEIINGGGDFSERRKNWSELTDAQSDSVIDGIISRMEETYLSSNKNGRAKTVNMLRRIRRTLRESSRIIRMSLTRGDYVCAECEKKFSLKTGGVIINGVIDRMDIAKTDEGDFLRIIDYKTGNKKYDFLSVYNCLDLQLVIYASAAMDIFAKSGSKIENGGMFYEQLKYQRVNAENASDAEKKRLKSLKLDGPVFVSEDEKKEAVQLDAMDKTLSGSGESEFLKLKYKRDGSLSGVEPDKYAEIMQRYIKNKIKQTRSGIMNGNISVAPYSDSKSTGCDYCPYIEICAFDRDKCEPRAVESDEESARIKMEEEVRDGEQMDG